MKILVSACLVGENCKYNGSNNLSNRVGAFIRDHEVICVCPEVMGGLPIPRPPAEIVGEDIINTEGVVVSEEFNIGAKRALDIALDNNIDLAILQSRSPSCGVNEVYDGTFSKKLIKGSGVFAKLLKENVIKVMDVEDL